FNWLWDLSREGFRMPEFACVCASSQPGILGVHNRSRDLDERWKSTSTGRRNRLPHRLRQTIDPARWGRRFRLPFPWPQSMVGIKLNKFPKTVNKHPVIGCRLLAALAGGHVEIIMSKSSLTALRAHAIKPRALS